MSRISLVVIVFLVACGGSKKAVDRPWEEPVSTRSRDRSAMPTESTAATVTANSGDDLSWLRPVYFPFDSSELVPATRDTLARLYEWLVVHPDVTLTIEGHCDEQGTTEYNIGLGQRRAQALVDYLARLGTSPSRLGAVSYGAERPVAHGHDEVAWSQNRRGEFRR